nr:hypothetical protein [Tanacetum cinerariifolium]
MEMMTREVVVVTGGRRQWRVVMRWRWCRSGRSELDLHIYNFWVTAAVAGSWPEMMAAVVGTRRKKREER